MILRKTGNPDKESMMLRALILAPMLILAAGAANAAVRSPLQATGSATLSATPVSGVSGAVTIPRTKATPVEAAFAQPRK